MTERAFTTPPHLIDLPHVVRFMKRCQYVIDAINADIEQLSNDSVEAGLAVNPAWIRAARDKPFMLQMNEIIGQIFDEGDANRPLHVVEALERCQTADDKEAAFQDLLKTVPATLSEVKAQTAFILDVMEATARKLTAAETRLLIKTISTPRANQRGQEIADAITENT